MSAGQLESLLSHIRDLLPDLGEGFVMSCLETYGYDGELVINNILEDRLTPELRDLDRNMPRCPLTFTPLIWWLEDSLTLQPCWRRLLIPSVY